MEINLPPEEEQDTQVEVKESNLLTVRVDAEGRYWWNVKRATPENLPQLLPTAPGTPDTVGYRFNADSLRGLLVEQNRTNPKLSTLVLIHRDASYADMVNILDEIDVIERSWNYAIAERLDKKVSELTKEDGKFSYRYAMAPWEDRDNKVLEAAIAAAQAAGLL